MPAVALEGMSAKQFRVRATQKDRFGAYLVHWRDFFTLAVCEALARAGLRDSGIYEGANTAE